MAADHPLVVFSGDAFNPSLLSTITLGEHMPPILNEIGVHVACIGEAADPSLYALHKSRNTDAFTPNPFAAAAAGNHGEQAVCKAHHGLLSCRGLSEALSVLSG